MSLTLGPYFPILRIKGSEKEAVKQIASAHQVGITPLIQQTQIPFNSGPGNFHIRKLDQSIAHR